MRVSQLVCVTSATVLLLAPVAVRAGDVLLQGDDPLAVASVDRKSTLGRDGLLVS